MKGLDIVLSCADVAHVVGASLSEPHIDEFAVNFLYIRISVVRRTISHFLPLFCVCQLICRTLCCKSLPALNLRILVALCVISKTTRTACRIQ